MATTLEGFAVECHVFGGVVLNKVALKATQKSAAAAKQVFLSAYAAAGYAKGFTNAKGGRTGIPISYKVGEGPTGPTAVVSAKGNIPRIIESGSYKHPEGYTIKPRKGRGAKGRAAARSAVVIPGVGVRASVHHPAQKPHPIFHTAARTLNKTTVPIFAAELSTGLRSTFR